MRFPVNYIDIRKTFIENKNIIFGYCPDDPYVYSIADGEVILSTYQNKYNNVIYIKHNNGLISMYKRLANTFVTTGQQVKNGDKIGTIGSTKGSSRKYLIFGLFSADSNYLNNQSNLDSLDYLEIYPNQEITLSTLNSFGIKIKYHDSSTTNDITNNEETSTQSLLYIDNQSTNNILSNKLNSKSILIVISLIITIFIFIYLVNRKVCDSNE